MTSKIDEICPPDVGAEKIGLQLTEPDVKLLAHVPFQISIDYSKALPVGVSLPIEVTIFGPEPGLVTRDVYKRALPSTLLLKPFSGGPHFILVREMFHNKWQGRLTVDVEGEVPSSFER
jgi:hypothetical protein